MGHQHYYKHSWDALSTVFRAEGFRGLVRGVDAAVLRTAMGSSVSRTHRSRYWDELMVDTGIGATTDVQLDQESAYNSRYLACR